MTRRCCPQMLARLAGGEADLVAGTRYVEGGSAASFSEGRGAISRAGDQAHPPAGGHAISAIPCRASS